MAKFSKEDLACQDLDIARHVLSDEGKEVNTERLEASVNLDRDILKRGRLLPEPMQQKINAAVHRQINLHREHLCEIFPDGFMEKNLDFTALTAATNTCVARRRENMDAGTLAKLARLKKSVARDVIQPLLVLQVDQDINALIDDNAEKSLEEIIEIVLIYLRDKVFSKNVKNVSFYLVNEQNQYEQIESITKVTPGIISTPMTKKEFDLGRGNMDMLHAENHHHGSRLITDHENNRIYLELNIKGLDLGVLQIDLKKGKNLNSFEMECLNQAYTRLDSKIDEAMRSKRLALIAQEAHRILDEHGTEEDFESGIAEFMVYVCRYSTAYEAEVFVDIFGDGEDFFAKNFNDDGIVTPLEVDDSIKTEVRIPSASRKIDDKKVLISDIVDTTNPRDGNIIGKVYFRTCKETDELRNEDRTLLTFCAGILHSHILAWRKHLQLRIEGVDPQIARTTMRGGVKDSVKEIITALYTDISGYTYLCEMVEDALRDTPDSMDDVETFKAVLSEFLNLVQQSGHSYGGVWDKAVGDMGLMEFGIPIDNNGLDPLGDNSQQRHPEYFALNALKTSLLIRHKLGAVTEKFREHLLKLACKKYAAGNCPQEIPPEQQDILLEKLKDETGLDPKIFITTSVYTGKSGYVKLPLGAASDWTGVGDAMNSAARIQGSSGKMEIRVPLLTRELVWPLIKTDRNIPTGTRGEKECWSDFVKNKLGMDPDLVEVDFTESYEGHKNRSGRNAVFTLTVRERNPEIDMIAPKSVLHAGQLLQYEGAEFAIENRTTADGKKQQFFLKTVTGDPEESISFRAIIPQESIEERVVKYTSPGALLAKKQNGTVNSLMVHEGHFKEFTWKSIEEDQDELLAALAEQMRKAKETVIVYNKLVPGGCYILASQEPAESDAYDILTIEKNNYTFKVRVSKSRIHEGPGPIQKDINILYDFQAYYGAIRGTTSSNKPVIFVHKRHFYKISPLEAETYILPIMTNPSAHPRSTETVPPSKAQI